MLGIKKLIKILNNYKYESNQWKKNHSNKLNKLEIRVGNLEGKIDLLIEKMEMKWK